MDPSIELITHVSPFQDQEADLSVTKFDDWVASNRYTAVRLFQDSGIDMESWNAYKSGQMTKEEVETVENEIIPNLLKFKDYQDLLEIKTAEVDAKVAEKRAEKGNSYSEKEYTQYRESLMREAVNKLAEASIIEKDNIQYEFIKGDLQIQKDRYKDSDEQKYRDFYCDPILYQDLLAKKKEFDTIDEKVYTYHRSRMNPFEKISHSIFFNRAAIKLANTDVVHDLTVNTSAVDSSKLYRRYANKIYSSKQTFEPLVENPPNISVVPESIQPFFFVDIAGAPGAMSQYILWRRPESRGYGISLKGNGGLDWNLSAILQNTTDKDRFKISYGVENGDGNLYNIDNIDAFAARVKFDFHHVKSTAAKKVGVNLAVADGGIHVGGKENDQEDLTFRLLVAQSLTALKCLGHDGHFFLKIFDTVRPKTVQLLQMLADCFDYINIIKPVSSRPANSEKYLVCKYFKLFDDPLAQSFNPTVQKIMGIMELYIKEMANSPDGNVPFRGMNGIGADFEEYIIDRNNLFIENQLFYVNKILESVKAEREGQQMPTLPRYHLGRTNAIWYLPEKSSAKAEEENEVLRNFQFSTYQSVKNNDPIFPMPGGKKYYSRQERDEFYSKLMMTTVGSYSVTSYAKNQEIISIITKSLNLQKSTNLSKLTIIDANGCVGGDTIGFANAFGTVYSIEKDQTNFKALKNNINAYGLNNKVIARNTSFLDIYESILRNQQVDVVYFDPPWGGVGYQAQFSIRLELDGIGMKDIVMKIRDINPNILVVIKVPKNFDHKEFKKVFKKAVNTSTIDGVDKDGEIRSIFDIVTVVGSVE